MQNNNEHGILSSANEQHSDGVFSNKNSLEIHKLEFPIYQMAIPENQKGQLETSGFGNGDISYSQNSQQIFSKELNANHNLTINNNLNQGHILGNYYFLQGKSLLISVKINLDKSYFNLIYKELIIKSSLVLN